MQLRTQKILNWTLRIDPRMRIMSTNTKMACVLVFFSVTLSPSLELELGNPELEGRVNENYLGLPCDRARYDELKIADWWEDYFTNEQPLDETKYAPLNALDQLDPSSPVRTGVCFLTSRLYECTTTNSSTNSGVCTCRNPQTKPFPYADAGVQTVRCRIAENQRCARRTKDYSVYEVTKRECEPNMCCFYQVKTGESHCQNCNRNGGSPSRLESAKFKFTATIIIAFTLASLAQKIQTF